MSDETKLAVKILESIIENLSWEANGKSYQDQLKEVIKLINK